MLKLNALKYELHSGSRQFIQDPSVASIISKQNKPLLKEWKEFLFTMQISIILISIPLRKLVRGIRGRRTTTEFIKRGELCLNSGNIGVKCCNESRKLSAVSFRVQFCRLLHRISVFLALFKLFCVSFHFFTFVILIAGLSRFSFFIQELLSLNGKQSSNVIYGAKCWVSLNKVKTRTFPIFLMSFEEVCRRFLSSKDYFEIV